MLPLGKGGTDVRAEHLYKRFGDKPVLEDVSLTVPEGAVLCLMAPSGWGKTTLLRCMAGLEKPDSGTVQGVPERIVAKPPSADLWPGQTDEGELGATYEDLDRVLDVLSMTRPPV